MTFIVSKMITVDIREYLEIVMTVTVINFHIQEYQMVRRKKKK